MYKNNKIQIEALKIIIETEKLIENLIKIEKNLESKNMDDKKTLSYKNLIANQEMLENEEKKLNNLEYVVAVVGTMKAGKSMTINAIVGQEILPSREFPMTTLPTLITHKAKQEKPILSIKDIEPFEKLLEEIKEKIEISKTSEQRDLNNLIDKIKNNKISFEESYEGQEEIEKFLKKINDLMRIAKDFEIEPPYKNFTDVDELPRIEVEFYHLSKQENNSNAKLTLLDTPGPDEFKHSELLKQIFEEQLKRASAIMLLVDYTKMNSQSDVEVKEQVKAVAEMIGKQHLFILINKFDQRKRSDDIEDKRREAKSLISEDILKGKVDTKNIYPISAKSAFYANFGLRELEKNGKIDTSLHWINDFGVTLMGEDWEEDIDDIERVRKKCKKTWEQSFFEEPLEEIISTIYNDALSLALESPLEKLENLLREYSNAFNIRRNAYSKELNDLLQIIESLKKDIEKVTEISENIQNSINDKIENIENKIKEEYENIIKEIKSNVKEELKTNKKKEDKEKKDRRNTGHFGNRQLWDGGLLDFWNKEKNEVINNGKLTYPNRTEATKVINRINREFIQLLKISSKELDKITNRNIKELSDDINENIKIELRDLVTKIEQKLGDEAGGLYISLPQLNINFDIDLRATLSGSIKTDKETYKIKGDSIIDGFLHWIKSDWGLVDKTRNIFIIDKKEFITKIGKALDDMQKSEMSKLSNKFDNKIKKPIDKKLQALKKEIDGYREEQVEIMNLKERNDKKIIEKMIENNNKYITKISTLNQRVQEAKKQLGQGCE